MTTTQLTNPIAPATTAEKLEVLTIPVADVDRAKAFYLSLGWRLDIDFEPAPGIRGVQFTPPGSPASIQFGSGSTTMTEPHQGLLLVVDDIEAARDDLIARGVDVGEIWHLEPGKGPVAGRRPASAARTSPERSSRTPTATSGSSRRSPNGCPAASSAPTPRRWPSCWPRPRSTTARSRPSPRRTTGGTGTPRTSPRARTETPLRRPTRPPTRT